jgi:hypothetical protein
VGRHHDLLACTRDTKAQLAILTERFTKPSRSGGKRLQGAGPGAHAPLRLKKAAGEAERRVARWALMPHVESQAIEALEYAPVERVLFVRFADGDWYAYLDVAPETYAAFTSAPSKGRFFQAEVRDRYAYRKIEP